MKHLESSRQHTEGPLAFEVIFFHFVPQDFVQPQITPQFLSRFSQLCETSDGGWADHLILASRQAHDL